MNILVVSQYFWPETFIINDLVQCLAANGHQIEVITGKPNYPEGAIFKGYTSRGCSTDSFNGIPVHRVPLLPRGKGIKKLLLNYFSFILSGFFYFSRFVKKKKFDIIFVFMPSPITSVLPAIYLKWRLQTHLAVWVQDLWPESIKATGFVKNSILLRLTGSLVKWIYKKSDTLLVQSQAFIQFMTRYTSQEKIIYYPNSFLEPSQAPINIPDSLMHELEHHSCFVFAGNLGKAQALETILQAAEKISHLPKCKILLIGSGSMSDWLNQKITAKGLKNLLLPGRYPPSMMSGIFSKATGLLVTLKNEEIFSYTIPSKIQAYLAAGRPILAAIDGEGARVLKDARAGLISSAEDATGLAKNIEELYYMPASERERLGKAGRDYFLQHFEMKQQSHRLIEILNSRIQRKEVI